MDKLIITRHQNKMMTALVSDGKAVEFHMEPEGSSSILNNIYIGKVKNIVTNINAAFVEFGEGQMGYYSLTENKIHHFVNAGHKTALRAGDELIVQVERDAVKTKAPVLTGNLSLTGKYCVLTAGKNQIGFSTKLMDPAWKNAMREKIEAVKEDGVGIIVRTNAGTVPEDLFLKEVAELSTWYHQLVEQSAYRTCYSVLYQAPPTFVTSLRDTYARNLEQIVTDDEQIFQALEEYLRQYQPEDILKLSYYQDQMLPLNKLYSLEAALAGALNKLVWLKSGGYLVIEQTEALVVVDVNTGKYSGKKNMRETILKINLEAAWAIAAQLRLRNLSGIIIIDFIDMETQEDKDTLVSVLEQACRPDPVKTTVIGMTKLNLVELTRKKVRKPLHEQAL